MLELRLDEFCTELASKSAVPGGGGAAALCGALAAALGQMVAGLTLGKKKYAQYEAEMQEAAEKGEQLRRSLLQDVEADALVFERLRPIYALPKDDPSRSERMENACREACEVPLGLMEKCLNVLELSELLSRHGSLLLVSDAGCAAVMAYAAMEAAHFTLLANTRCMQDGKKQEAQAAILLEKGKTLRDEICTVAHTRLNQ